MEINRSIKLIMIAALACTVTTIAGCKSVPFAQNTAPDLAAGDGCTDVEGRPPCMLCPNHNRAIEADWAMESTNEVAVDYENKEFYISYQPTTLIEEKITGILMLAGGGVPPSSYAPAAHRIASQGYRTFIARNLPAGEEDPCSAPPTSALFNTMSAIMQENSDVTQWVLAGHSLGGINISSYMYDRGIDHPEIKGLVIWGAYAPVAGDDRDNPILPRLPLSGSNIAASRDGVTPWDINIDNAHRLPDPTQTYCIEGGNHANFGWYNGSSPSDIPLIAHENQQTQIDAQLSLYMGIVEAGETFPDMDNKAALEACKEVE